MEASDLQVEQAAEIIFLSTVLDALLISKVSVLK